MGNELTIGETCYVTDGAHAKVKRQESGILYLTSKNITNGELKLDKVDWISEVDFNKLFSNTTKSQRLLQTGDVLMGIIGTLGNAYLYKSDDKFGISSSVAILRAEPTKLMSEFLYYIVTSEKFKRTVEAYKGGSVQGYTNIATLKSLPIPNVTLNEQKKAVTILSSLDKKIQLNKKTNQTLEQMAQALFKSWFVDFDPVFDNLLASVDFKLENLETSLPDELKQKAQRRLAALNSLENAAECKASLIALAHELQAQLPTKEATVQVSEKAAETPFKANFNANPNILAQHANTHAHFPNEFEHNEQLGWIPKGWEKAQIQDLAKVVKGKSYKSAELSDSSTALVTLKSFKRGGGYRLDGLKAYTGKYKPEQEVFAGDLIVAYTDVTQAADVIGKPAMVISDTKYEHLVVSLDVAVVRCFDEIHKNYLYGVMKTDAFQNHSRSYTSGTTVLHLKKEAVPEYWLALPDTVVLSAFLEVSTPLYEKIDRLIDENRALTKLRDTLLPKLISGELQIPDVVTDEKIVD